MPVSSYIDASVLLTEAEQYELRNLALQVIKNAVHQRKFILPTAPKTKALQRLVANFVTLYVDDELRGCIGCYTSEQPLWQSVSQHAYNSAFEDYRFSPLQAAELMSLRINISILSDLLPMENKGEQTLIACLEPEIDGLLIREPSSKRSAIFLPSVWSSLAETKAFVHALKQKGGWSSDYWSNDFELFRFHTQIF